MQTSKSIPSSGAVWRNGIFVYRTQTQYIFLPFYPRSDYYFFHESLHSLPLLRGSANEVHLMRFQSTRQVVRKIPVFKTLSRPKQGWNTSYTSSMLTIKEPCQLLVFLHYFGNVNFIPIQANPPGCGLGPGCKNKLKAWACKLALALFIEWGWIQPRLGKFDPSEV